MNTRQSKRQSLNARQRRGRAVERVRREHAGRPGFTGVVTDMKINIVGKPPKRFGLGALYITSFTNAVASPVSES